MIFEIIKGLLIFGSMLMFLICLIFFMSMLYLIHDNRNKRGHPNRDYEEEVRRRDQKLDKQSLSNVKEDGTKNKRNKGANK